MVFTDVNEQQSLVRVTDLQLDDDWLLKSVGFFPTSTSQGEELLSQTSISL